LQSRQREQDRRRSAREERRCRHAGERVEEQARAPLVREPAATVANSRNAATAGGGKRAIATPR
jgi:hypothetical protein